MVIVNGDVQASSTSTVIHNRNKVISVFVTKTHTHIQRERERGDVINHAIRF